MKKIKKLIQKVQAKRLGNFKFFMSKPKNNEPKKSSELLYINDKNGN
jgi:hypothetical protein